MVYKDTELLNTLAAFAHFFGCWCFARFSFVLNVYFARFFASLIQIDLDIIFQGVLHLTKVELLTGAAFKDVEDVQTGRLKVAGGIIGLADEHVVASTVIQRLKRVRYLNYSIFSIFLKHKKYLNFIIQRFPKLNSILW